PSNFLTGGDDTMNNATRSTILTLLITICGLQAGLTTTTATATGSCPNEQFRTGYSAALPDSRAYELVSPPEIQPYFESFGELESVVRGASLFGSIVSTYGPQTSAVSRIAYSSTPPPSASTSGGPEFLSSRGVGGGNTQGLVPPQSTEA